MLTSTLVMAQQSIDTTRISSQKITPLLELVILEYMPPANPTDWYTSDSLKYAGARDLGELIVATNPVFIKSYGANGIKTLSLRGGKPEQTKVMWNAMDITYPGLGQIDLSLVPLSSAEKVEISSGQSSLTDITGGLSGVLSLGSDNYRDEGNRLTISQTLSSLLNSDTHISYVQSKRPVSWRVYGEYNRGENKFTFENPALPNHQIDTSEHAAYHGGAVGGSWSKRFNYKHILEFNGFYKMLDRELPSSTTSLETNLATMYDQIGVVSGKYILDYSKVQVIASSGLMMSSNKYENPAFGLSGLNKAGSFQSAVKVSFPADKKSRIFVVNARNYVEFLNSDNIPDSSRVNNRITGWVGLERSNYKDFVYRTGVRVEQNGKSFSGILPMLQFNWRIRRLKKLIWSVSASKNVRFPTMNERYWNPGGNPDLLHEESYMLESSLRKMYDLVFGKWNAQGTLSLTGYIGDYSNWTVWLPTASFWQPENIRRVVAKGMEGELEMLMKKGKSSLFLNQKINLNRSTIGTDDLNESNEGRAAIYSPLFQALTHVKLSYKRWYAFYIQPITGKYYISTDNSSYMPGFTTASLGLGKKLKGIITDSDIAISIANLANWQYQVMPNQAMPGRHLKLSWSVTFK